MTGLLADIAESTIFLFNPFTTIYDGNFRLHLSCYVTMHDGNFRRIYYSYSRIPVSWHALRPGSEVVKKMLVKNLHNTRSTQY